MTALNINRVLASIRDHLAKTASRGVKLLVADNAYREEGEWLYVVVSPEGAGIRAYDYVSTLGEVERALHKEGFDHVLLVPAMPD